MSEYPKEYLDNKLSREDIESLGFRSSGMSEKVYMKSVGDLLYILNTGWSKPYTMSKGLCITVRGMRRSEESVEEWIMREQFLFNGKIEYKHELENVLKYIGV